MKLLVSALALGFVLTASMPQAQAHVCADGSHRTHCISHRRFAYRHHHRHFWHCHFCRPEGGVITAVPPPYVYYYPPMPASIFDLPPGYRFPANQLQWLMNEEGDVPYTTYPRYRWYWYPN